MDEVDDYEDAVTQSSLISSDDSMNYKDINDVYELLNQLEKERVQTNDGNKFRELLQVLEKEL